jgi:hypothetical protein
MDVAPPAVTPETLTRNLAALSSVDPAFAASLAEPLPDEDCYTPAPARDGQISFRRTHADGSVEWLGRSSIPWTRALVTVEQFQPGNGNVLLPGISAGIEAKLLCERLGSHRAVFVWEPNALAVRLALRLHDLQESIAEQRLVLLVCPFESLSAAFVEWLREHPGHLCPDRLLMYPWQTYAEMASIRSAIEAVHRETEERRAAEMAKLPAVSAADSGLERPSIALLAMHTRQVNWATVDALAAAVRALGGSATIADIRGPADMHPLARTQRLAAAGKLHAAILIDILRGDVSDILPGALPVVSWMSGQVIPESVGNRIGPADKIAAANNGVAEQFITAGANADQVMVCPPPCLAPPAPAADAERDVDIAIFADLLPTESAAYGYTLETHAQLWQAAVELLKADVELFSDARIADLLSQAERRLKVRVDDASTRKGMVRALAQCVAPALLWQRVMSGLAETRLALQLRGAGWPADAPSAGPASLQEHATLCRRAKVVIHIDPSNAATSQALIAAGSGAVLLARAESHHRQPGGLATLLEPGTDMLVFSSTREMLTQARRLVSDASLRAQIAARAVARCHAEHGVSARLRTLLSVLASSSPLTAS